jgi:predicted nucleotidyltransferase
MDLDPQLIGEIVARVVRVAQPVRLVLFGSAATGTMTRDSDIDLLVVEERAADPRRESLRIRRSLRGLGVAFDIIVMSQDRFEATKDVIGGIAYPAHRYGRVIHAA